MALLLASLPISCIGGEPLFPFVLPWDDASAGVANVSGLLGKPAGGHGFVVAKDGHLFEGGKRFRIFGVNTVFGANFPSHDDAEKIAARMAKFGINCVRFHHMDWHTAPDGIWNADLKTLDPGQLDKVDYFIAQLKKNGIYADLNLHVSRTYPGMPSWEGAPSFFKGVDLFYPPMIEMQHDYARQLLTHVNPYTKTAYVDEPAVAFIEINNENGLICEWWGGSLDNMPDAFRKELEKPWNQWLKAKYPSEESLRKAWNVGEEPLGVEMLKEGAFESGTGKVWNLEQHEGAKAEATSIADGGLRVNVTAPGKLGWHVQLSQGGIVFDKDRHYTISFRARAAEPRRITVVASQAHAPWEQIWSVNLKLTTGWKDYHFTFQPASGDENARIVFSDLGAAAVEYAFASVSLRPGGVMGLQAEETPGTMPVFRKADFGMRTAEARGDWMHFLWETEEHYWTGMSEFIKKDLKARNLVVGTATGFSPPPIQAKLDIVDVHAYWQHPHFPHKSWDPADWYVPNIPMTDAPDGGTIPELMLRRVAGKPYICTEYNAAAPNTYNAETFLLLNAYAALNDWDGIFAFAYSHRRDDWGSRHITGFFDIDQHPLKMATLPAAVAMFVRGDVSRAVTVEKIPVSREAAIGQSVLGGSWWTSQALGVGKLFPFQSMAQMDVSDAPSPASAVKKFPGPDAGKAIVSDTGELVWGADNGTVTVNSPRSKAFIGRVTGKPVVLGDVTIDLQPNMQNWGAVTLTAMDGVDFKAPGRILVTATGYAESTGMKWNAAKNSVGRNWGAAPSLVEGIAAKITLPVPASRLKAWALDERGQRKGELKIEPAGTGSLIVIGPQYQTFWYEVEAGR